MSSKRALTFLLVVTIFLSGCGKKADAETRDSNANAALISAADKSILFVHGNAVGLVQPRCDIALGTQASWHPYSNRIVVATSGVEKQLILAELSVVEGQPEVVQQKPLPIPSVKRFGVEWQWSFSPNRRWLVVSRQVAGIRYWPYKLMTQESVQAAQDIHWIGLVDLNSGKARKFEFFPSKDLRWYLLLGWRGDACLFQAGEAILSVDAMNPSKAHEILKGGFTSIVALSPDGHKIITYDGREGSIEVKMLNLQTGAERVLLSEPRGNIYGRAGEIEAVFSQDSRWVAIMRFVGEGDSWQVIVSLESIDGKEITYKDEFVMKDAKEMDFIPRIQRIHWSPVGPERFFYFRPSDSEDGDIVVIVGLQGTKVEKRVKKLYKKRLSRNHKLPPIWSPKGDYIALLTEERDINIFEIEGDTMAVLGKLPDDAISWTWAPPRVTKEQ